MTVSHAFQPLAAENSPLALFGMPDTPSSQFLMFAYKGDPLKLFEIYQNHHESADFNLQITTPSGLNAVALAAKGGHLNAMRTAIGLGVSVMQQDCENNVPMHHAVRGGSLAVVEELIKHYETLAIRNDDNQTPEDLARLLKDEGILKALQRGKVALPAPMRSLRDFA